MGTSTEDLLRGAAKRGDALADGVVEAFVRDVRPDDLLDYLQNTIRLPTRIHLDEELTALGESQPAREVFRKFLEEMSRPRPWIRPEQVEEGAAFFRNRVSAAAIALGTSSLPTCYCWSPEADVLMYTQRLASDAPRRILETAQFVLDVMSRRGLTLGVQPFTRGVQAVQKIRLMHAVVRFVLRNRPVLYLRALERYKCSTAEELAKVGKTKNPWLGFLLAGETTAPGDDLPINQEQLAGTILTFSIVILQSFRKIGIFFSREQTDAYLHAWNVVGYLLGVEEELLERMGNLESAEELRMGIMQRHRRPTENARQLTGSLSKYLAEDIELILRLQRWIAVDRIPRLTMWMLLEHETREATGIALDRKDRLLYWPLRFVALLVGLLHNLPGAGRLSTLLFDYLSRNVWAWRGVPFSQPPVDARPLAHAAERALDNWSATVETMPARVVHPSSTAQIKEIVRDATAYPSPLRVMGAFHSTTPCASADGGTVIQFDRLKRVLEIGPDFVEAEAGALYMEVAHELYRRGLEFYVNLQVGNITMGAAACSTTKDGAFPDEYAQASSYCTAMTLVLPDGSVRRIDESTPALMQAARCSHGLLGVLCVVRFKVRPMKPISIEHHNLSVDEFLKALPALKADNCSLEYYLYPFIDRVTVQIRRKTEDKGEVDRRVWKLRNFSVSRIVPLAARIIGALPGRWLRDAVSGIFYRVSSFGLAWLCSADKTYALDQMTRYLEPPGRYGFTFGLWGFPEETFPQILRDYIALLKSHYEQTGYRSHMLTVGYVVSQDAQALLSYSSSGRVITIDPTGFGGADWDRFLDVYNEFCSDRGGVPLLNQTPRLNAGHLRRAFGERLAEFEATRRAYDPGGRLLNEYFAALLQDAGS